MNQSTKQILFIVMAGIVLLTACAPAAAATAPTQDPALVQQLIQQSVALTVAAQNAQTLEAQAALPAATNTPLPTQTAADLPSPTPLIPTATPFVIVPPAAPVTGGGGGGVTVKSELACDIRNQKPYDNSLYKPNKPIDIKWTIVNTGTKTWKAGLDLVYFSGPKMTTPASSVPIQLPEMKPGDQFDVDLDAYSPETVGFHVMTWKLEGGFCYPYIAIYVDK